MKKIFFVAIMLAFAWTLNAQQVPSYRATDMSLAVPVTIKSNFETTYPGVTVVTWEPMNDWWYATYKDENNRLVQVYYNTQPYYLIRNENFKVSLPALNTYVPEDVITNAVDKYGTSLYSITAMKGDENGTKYQVTLIQDGKSETVMIDSGSMAYNGSFK